VPGLVAWTILYISDYSLTIACARLYQAGAREKIAFEGSYEITPYYQGDINALRSLSPRFLAALLFSLVWLSAVWWLAMESFFPAMYIDRDSRLLWTVCRGVCVHRQLVRAGWRRHLSVPCLQAFQARSQVIG